MHHWGAAAHATCHQPHWEQLFSVLLKDTSDMRTIGAWNYKPADQFNQLIHSLWHQLSHCCPETQ